MKLLEGRRLLRALLFLTLAILNFTATSLPIVSYLHHGADWAAAGQCGSGERQSPISLDLRLEDPPSESFRFNYELIKSTDLELNASQGALSLEVGALAAGGVEYHGSVFYLQRIVFHGPAEHVVAGKRQPLELQLVHREGPDSGAFLIVAVPIWSESTPQPANVAVAAEEYLEPDTGEADFNINLQRFVVEKPPAADGQTSVLSISEDEPLDLNLFFEDAQAQQGQPSIFVHYAGSLTSPPCEGRVTWLVRRSAVVASNSQVKALAGALFSLTSGAGSYRALMPPNGRAFFTLTAERVATLEASVHGTSFPKRPPLPWGPEPRTDGELHALRAAKAANAKAESGFAYAKEVAQHISKANEAYSTALHVPSPSEALAPSPPPPPAAANDVVSVTRTAMRGVATRLRSEAASVLGDTATLLS